MKSRLISVYVRSLIFGVEDSLVSTVGLIAGIAAAGVSHSGVLLTGVILIAVEGFSMAAGSFLSERSVEEYSGKANTPMIVSIMAGVVMFLSYAVAGLIPLFPYILQLPDALYWSIAASLAGLFLFGAISAHHFKVAWISRGFRMLIVGGIAIAFGIAVGRFVRF
jgi:VIT1/CCC1 family predicted Fe2+/Mn2+ transporter